MNSPELCQKIEQSTDLSELRRLKDSFSDVRDTSTETINIMHDTMIRKTLTMAEERVGAAYGDAPPISSFVLVLLGSGGRREQTPWSDQDHGFIYQLKEGASSEMGNHYSSLLANGFQQSLEEVGYPPCEGNVLATNPEWHMTLEDWKKSIRTWLAEPEFENVRRMLVLADARAIYGNEQLASELGEELYRAIAVQSRSILPRMLQNTLRYKMLVGWLGNWLTEPYGQNAGGIDIKYGAYLPMVNAIRLLAIKSQAAEVSTLQRIEALQQCGVFDQETAANVKRAFQIILKLRAAAPRGCIFVHMLSKDDKRELKRALRTGAELQKMVKRVIGVEGWRS